MTRLCLTCVKSYALKEDYDLVESFALKKDSKSALADLTKDSILFQRVHSKTKGKKRKTSICSPSSVLKLFLKKTVTTIR